MSDAAFDPYETLEVHPRASIEVITAAYRALARRFHPDLTRDPQAAPRMVAINRAWELLRDPARRADHDRVIQAAAAAPTATTYQPGGDDGRRGIDRQWEGGAGRPRGLPFGSRLDFGLYKGWTLGQVLRADPAYLIWLEQQREGQPYAAEIDRLLRNAALRVNDPPVNSRRAWGTS